MNEHIENAKTILKSATKGHNDDCILCAMKDTRIGDALVELEAVRSKPEPIENAKKKLRTALSQIDEAQSACPSPACDILSNAGMNIDLALAELEAAESKPVIWNRSKWLLLGRFKNWCWLGRLNEIKTTWQWQIVYHGDMTENKP